MEFSVSVNASGTIQDLNRAASQAPIMAAAITQRNSERLLREIRRGSPVDTGEYRDSHRIELKALDRYFQAEVGSDLDRGESLEFGAVITSADGSTDVRPPQPHFRPAFELVSEDYYEELARYITP